MVETHSMKKVEIVIDDAAVERVIKTLEEAGAKGYTLFSDVSGKGHRGLRSAADDIYDTFKNAMIVVVTREAVAERVVEEVLAILGSYSGIVYTSDVRVARAAHF